MERWLAPVCRHARRHARVRSELAGVDAAEQRDAVAHRAQHHGRREVCLLRHNRRHRTHGTKMKKIRVICVLLLLVSMISAQSGVLIPSTSSNPDSRTLSLNVMNVDVLIDNQHARVKVLQIFDNHTSQILEGKYLFALPPAA